MTDKTIEILYEYGKKVFNNEISIDQAVNDFTVSNPGEKESSARHYILWYTRMRAGEYLTWNTNQQLLCYYVRQIIFEEGKEAGKIAFDAAMKYADYKNSKMLKENLYSIAEENILNLENEGEHLQISKETWLELLNDKSLFGPAYLGTLAAFYEAGGEVACGTLDNKYNRPKGSIRALATQISKHVYEKLEIKISKRDNGQNNYWPVLFVGRKAKANEYGSFLWKLRPELEEALTEFGILDYLWENKEIKIDLSINEILKNIKLFIESKGFSYNNDLIENFYLSIKSKPFVILAGTSGTGKTRLVKLFAEAIGAKYKLVPVRPDWSDGSDLIGHYDLNGEFKAGPVYECFKEAHNNRNKAVFLCLDEMNLARVEYYLSDFLSVIESREKDSDGVIFTSPISDYKEYKKGIPDNLYIVGTVNMDETTFPFSKKVLDRANTIEFNYVDLINPFTDIAEDKSAIEVDNSFLKTEYLNLSRDCRDDKKYVEGICAELQKINEILLKANAHVGYRVRDEIVFYMLNNKNAENILSDNEAFDNEIMQKILPRIQGSSSSVKDMLCDLFAICATNHNEKSGDTDAERMRKVIGDTNIACKYKKSAEKIELMVRRFEEDGFTSYWL